MSRRFTKYEEARKEAQTRANSSGLDVAIRRVKEFGKDGFNVTYASRNDSDYDVAEIVTPERKTLKGYGGSVRRRKRYSYRGLKEVGIGGLILAGVVGIVLAAIASAKRADERALTAANRGY